MLSLEVSNTKCSGPVYTCFVTSTVGNQLLTEMGTFETNLVLEKLLHTKQNTKRFATKQNKNNIPRAVCIGEHLYLYDINEESQRVESSSYFRFGWMVWWVSRTRLSRLFIIIIIVARTVEYKKKRQGDDSLFCSFAFLLPHPILYIGFAFGFCVI